jgi:mannosylglycoprotein endo-beta-mannosidase
MNLLEQKETYWRSRCHEQCLLKGDNNTNYFHKIANGRKRKNIMITLERNGELIEENENLLNHATEYYTELFGPKTDHDIHIEQSLWDELSHVSDEENHKLCKPFSESKIKEALFLMEKIRLLVLIKYLLNCTNHVGI